MIRELKVGSTAVALLLDTSDVDYGTHPASYVSAPLQVLMVKRKSGDIVEKHTHKKNERITSTRQKAVVVVGGSIEVIVCDRSGIDGESCVVETGQCLYMLDGGYTITMKEEAVFFEFKNGPHIEDKILL